MPSALPGTSRERWITFPQSSRPERTVIVRGMCCSVCCFSVVLCACCVAWRGGQRQAMLKRFGAPVGVLGTNFARGSKPFARQTFEKYIVNGDDERIDRGGFRRLCFDLGYHLTDTEAELAFEVVDVDHSGLITYEEFYNWASRWSTDDLGSSMGLSDADVELRDKAKAVFEQFDADGNGEIDRAEFGAFFDNLHAAGLCGDDKEKVMAGLDANNSHTISFNEYMQWLVRFHRVKVNDVD